MGSQSVRVCNSGFTSCNDVCAARALEPTADISTCLASCCNQFNVCLKLRNCRERVIDCGGRALTPESTLESPLSPSQGAGPP